MGRSLTGMKPVIAITVWLWLGLGCGGWGLLHGCTAGMRDVRAEATLDTLAQVIDPAYSAATDACLAEQHAVVSEMERHAITPDQAKALVQAARVNCDRIEAAFERIRALHEAAKIAYRGGRDDQFEQVLRQLEQAWADLKGGGT